MQPAQSIVAKLGGPTKVARIVSVHRTRVHGWMQPRESGGTGGVIPIKHVPALLAFAIANGIDLGANDFIPLPPADRPAEVA